MRRSCEGGGKLIEFARLYFFAPMGIKVAEIGFAQQLASAFRHSDSTCFEKISLTG